MRYEKVLVSLALGIIILIAAFNIISSLVMAVNDKTREIGILRAMGATRRSILRIFVFEGMLIGLVGSLTGNLTRPVELLAAKALRHHPAARRRLLRHGATRVN